MVRTRLTKSGKTDFPISLLRRAAAYGIDLYLGTLCATLPVSIITYVILGEITQNVFLLEKSTAILSLLLSLLALFVYYMITPLKLLKGQTLGKKIMHIQICFDNNKSLIVRQLVMMIFFTTLTKIWTQLLILITGVEVLYIINEIIMPISFLSVITMLINKEHLALHDRVSKTDLKKI